MRKLGIALTFAFLAALTVIPVSAQEKPLTANDIEKLLPQSKQLTADDIDKLFKNASPVKPASGGTVMDRMMYEVQACWNMPAFKEGDVLPETQVTVNVEKDGSLLSDPIVLKSGKDTLGKQLAESAVRAVKRCAPFKTVKDNPQAYEQLRTIIFNFKPSAL